MTLLTMCQQVARETGQSVPSSIVTNTGDPIATKLLAAAQTEGRSLSRGKIPDGMGVHDWSVLRTEQTFSTSNGVASYALTSSGIITNNDFRRFVADTFWDRTNNRKLWLATPAGWQWSKGSVSSTSDFDRKLIQRGNSLYIDPTPTSTDTIAFEYISKNWCESSGGTDQSAWAADTDTGILDEELMSFGIKWRFLQAIGMPYLDEKEEYEQEVSAAMGNDGGAQTLFQSAGAIPFGRVPESGFGS